MSTSNSAYMHHPQGCKIGSGDTFIHLFTDAAWLFAKALLWPDHIHDQESEAQARSYIQNYFESTRGSVKSFIAFCERVALTNRYLAANPKRYLPSPDLWLNPFYEYGFASTLGWLRQVRKTRESAPGYMEHIEVLSGLYLSFIQRPCRETIAACQDKLNSLGAPHLLKEFYAAVVLFTYFNK